MVISHFNVFLAFFDGGWGSRITISFFIIFLKNSNTFSSSVKFALKIILILLLFQNKDLSTKVLSGTKRRGEEMNKVAI